MFLIVLGLLLTDFVPDGKLDVIAHTLVFLFHFLAEYNLIHCPSITNMFEVICGYNFLSFIHNFISLDDFISFLFLAVAFFSTYYQLSEIQFLQYAKPKLIHSNKLNQTVIKAFENIP